MPGTFVFGPNEPATSAAVVDISSDDATIAPPCRALYVGVGGDIRVTLEADSSPVTLRNVSVGVLPICARIVHKVGTTASEIVALR